MRLSILLCVPLAAAASIPAAAHREAPESQGGVEPPQTILRPFGRLPSDQKLANRPLSAPDRLRSHKPPFSREYASEEFNYNIDVHVSKRDNSAAISGNQKRAFSSLFNKLPIAKTGDLKDNQNSILPGSVFSKLKELVLKGAATIPDNVVQKKPIAHVVNTVTSNVGNLKAGMIHSVKPNVDLETFGDLAHMEMGRAEGIS